ncbi:histidine phosphatase family protein [Streptomyces sp. NPDC020917]|uniref:histidine phosphatase family protein n=1 Tax=Streptomyces sp. NPDC020917 TaxID=3365102 RepID=UPI00378FD6B1
MTVLHLVQHAEKKREPGDPGLTELGRRQAAATAEWARQAGVRALFSSPLRRARETAQPIAFRTGLLVREDVRLRERMNWDGDQSIEEFLAQWATAVRDRDFVTSSGESSRDIGERMRACLAELAGLAGSAGQPGPVAVVTHGGATVDLLRTLIGDRAVPAELMDQGVPSCAITTLDQLSVVEIASVSYLTSLPPSTA